MTGFSICLLTILDFMLFCKNNVMKKIILFLFSLALCFSATAQVGGDNVYEFLNLSASARITGLGGNLISVKDDDVALAYANPSTLNARMHQAISFNYNFHLADINNGYFAYAHHIDKWDATVHGGIQFIKYGTFQNTNEIGEVLGEFEVDEYAFTFGASKQLYENLSVGANFKLITSQFEAYNSVGIAGDFGAFYSDTTGRKSITLVFKNVGTQLSTYRADNREPLPLDVQLGISRRLNHLPFRVSIIAHNLHRWNITYDDPNNQESIFLIGDGESQGDSDLKVFIDNLSRHFIFSGEFLFGKKEVIRLRFGYNHFMRKELSVNNFRSLSGFTFGAGIKINRFRIDYGRGVYHLAGGVNHLSISTNLKEFRR